MLPPRSGDIRGQGQVPEWRRGEVPEHNALARRILDILVHAGWSLRALAEETPCGKSSLANYWAGRRDVPPVVVAALVPLVARVVPAIPVPLRRSLVLLRYDVTALTPAFRWDTVVLEVPKPEAWLGSVPSGIYEFTTADVARHRVEGWLQEVLAWDRHNPTIEGPGGKRHVHRREMGDIVERFRHAPGALHPFERVHRELRVWLRPFNPRADYWFRVQFTPLHRDHQCFIGRLIERLRDGWGHVRLARLDGAFDFRGAVGDFIPVYEGRRVRNDCPSLKAHDGQSFKSVACGSRRGRVYLRGYDRTEPDGARRARFEVEWKPRKEDRPLLRDLADTPFPVSVPIDVLPARYLGRTPGDCALLDKVFREGEPGLSPSEKVRLYELRAVAAKDGVAFSYTSALARLWPEGLAVLADLIAACCHRPPPHVR